MKQAKESEEEAKIEVVLAFLDGKVEGCGCGKAGKSIFKTVPCDVHRHLWEKARAWEVIGNV